jgi:3-phosphoshikimate 1-carboxyvinyltransferase
VNKKITRFPSGTVKIPPSKSILHRAVICAALAGVEVKLSPVSDDIDATVRCVNALTTEPQEGEGELQLDCGESGSTLRFLIPIAAALGKSAVFTGRGRLMSRPLEPFLDELRRHGAVIEQEPDAINVSGALRAGRYELPGDISSQFVTGLLFALPLLRGDSEIHLTSPLESAAYVDLTVEELEKSGIEITRDGADFAVRGNQEFAAREVAAEGDYSQAAFFLAAAALGRDVRCEGLNPDSTQGDAAILQILQDAGFEIELASTVRVLPRGGQISRRNRTVLPVEIDVSGIPDLVPPVAALLSVADGTSRLYNAGRLRLKESDRLEAVAAELNAIGADIEIDDDALIIYGRKSLDGGTVNARGDHRIAMMAAVAAIRSDAPVTVIGAECVSKSYPNFWKDFEVSAK